mgnify:CR=1 FL=1
MYSRYFLVQMKELYSKVAFTISQIKTSQQRLQLNQSRSTNESMISWLKSIFKGDFDGSYNRKAEDRKALSFLEPALRDLAILGKVGTTPKYSFIFTLSYNYQFSILQMWSRCAHLNYIAWSQAHL